MSEELKPCPFCGAGQTVFRENGKVWCGMKYSEPVSVTVQHWCEEVKGQPSRVLERAGRDRASAIEAWNTRSTPKHGEAAGWQPIETAPKSGEFLIGVWEGDWNQPRTRFRIYHATGFPQGPSWAQKGNYRTEEGGAYELAGWMAAPKEPKP
jgi:hypothetical protein